MRIHKLKKFSKAFLLVAIGAGALVGMQAQSAPPGSKQPRQTVANVPEVIDVIGSMRDWNVAPQACAYESIKDLNEALRGTPHVAPGRACSPEQFYNFVCQSSDEQDKRRRGASLNYARFRGLAIARAMAQSPGAPKGLAEEIEKNITERFPTSPPPKGALPTVESVIVNSASREAFRRFAADVDSPAADPSKQERRVAFDREFQGLIQNQYGDHVLPLFNTAKRAFVESGGVLDQMRQSMERAGGGSAQGLNAFLEAAFNQMKELVKNVELDTEAPQSLCLRDQRNVIFVRQASGNPKIVICPGTLLTNDSTEILGSLARALGHAVDSCALDRQTVGSPAITLTGLLEPLRGCLGSRIQTSSRAINALAELIPPIPLPDRSRYEERVRAAIGDGASAFHTQGIGAPHCAAPFTSEELQRVASRAGSGGDLTASGIFGKRDQSNDAVAQYYASKVIARLAVSNPNQQERIIRGAFSSYCGTEYHARSTHPNSQLLLNKAIGFDPDIRGLVCPEAKDEVTSERNRAIAEGMSAFSNPSESRAPAPPKSGKASCDGALARGGAAYHTYLSSAAPVKFDVKPTAAPGPGAPAPDPRLGAAAAAAKAGSEGRNSTSAPGRKSPPERFEDSDDLAQKLAERENAIDQALLNERESCVGIVEQGRFPLASEAEVLRSPQACGASRLGRADIDLFEGRPHFQTVQSPSGTSYRVKVSCISRCLCGDRARCYMPEPVYAGMDNPVVTPSRNCKTISADLYHYLRTDEPHHRYGLAMKACFKRSGFTESAPEAAEACSAAPAGAKSAVIRQVGGQDIRTRMIGETSGVAFNLKCEFRCDCGSSPHSCVAMVHPPVMLTWEADGRPKLYEGACKDDRVMPMATPEEYKAATEGSLSEEVATYLAPPALGVAPLSGSSSSDAPRARNSDASRARNANRGSVDADRHRSSSRGSAALASLEYRTYGHTPPALTTLVKDRQIARLSAETKANEQCKEILKANRPSDALSSDQEAYCASGRDRFVPTDLVQVIGTSTEKTSQITFTFKCGYDCKSHEPKLEYVREKVQGEPIIDLGTPEGREQARLADFEGRKWELDHYCQVAANPSAASDQLRDADLLEIAIRRREKATEALCTDKKRASESTWKYADDRIYLAGKPVGELSRGPIPYVCEYSGCDCSTKVCKNGIAYPTRPVDSKGKDLDLSALREWNDSRPLLRPIRGPADESEFEGLRARAITSCVKAATTNGFARDRCKRKGAVVEWPTYIEGERNEIEIRCTAQCSVHCVPGESFCISDLTVKNPFQSDAPDAVNRQQVPMPPPALPSQAPRAQRADRESPVSAGGAGRDAGASRAQGQVVTPPAAAAPPKASPQMPPSPRQASRPPAVASRVTTLQQFSDLRNAIESAQSQAKTQFGSCPQLTDPEKQQICIDSPNASNPLARFEDSEKDVTLGGLKYRGICRARVKCEGSVKAKTRRAVGDGASYVSMNPPVVEGTACPWLTRINPKANQCKPGSPASWIASISTVIAGKEEGKCSYTCFCGVDSKSQNCSANSPIPSALTGGAKDERDGGEEKEQPEIASPGKIIAPPFDAIPPMSVLRKGERPVSEISAVPQDVVRKQALIRRARAAIERKGKTCPQLTDVDRMKQLCAQKPTLSVVEDDLEAPSWVAVDGALYPVSCRAAVRCEGEKTSEGRYPVGKKAKVQLHIGEAYVAKSSCSWLRRIDPTGDRCKSRGRESWMETKLGDDGVEKCDYSCFCGIRGPVPNCEIRP